MRKITELFIISLLAFSSAFFIGSIQIDQLSTMKKAEAICGIGEHYNQGGDGMSKPTDGDCKKENGVLGQPDAKSGTHRIIKPLMNTFAALVLAGSLISFVYSGFEMIRYGTNQSSAERAKTRILHTGLAIIVTLSVYSIYSIIEDLIF